VSTALWAIAGLPLLGPAVAFATPRRWRPAAGAAIGACALATLLALLLLVSGRPPLHSALAWVRSPLPFSMGLRLDATSGVAAVVVGAVSCVIAVYSTGYLRPGEDRGRFFATLGLFAASMLTLVLADSLLTLFVAWELVGLCSYLLIGHHREEEPAQSAALKAFLTTRVADLALLAGVLVAIVASGTVSLDGVFSWAGRGDARAPVVAALLLVGVAGKSAQLPFSFWLPDAMRGPTPVSALLHSATMVAAGAYLLVRLFPLFTSGAILPAVAGLGLVTAVFASLAALAQSDLKRVLAYSTIAQLAEMIAAVGLGAPVAALLLLLAHAGYKAALFCAAGVLQHDAGSTEMAAIADHAPRRRRLAHVAFVLAGLALVGIPISIAPSARDGALASGFDAGPLPAAVLLGLAVLAGGYMARAYRLTFWSDGRATGAPRNGGRDIAVMGLAAVGLVAGVVVLGVLTSPLLADPLGHLLNPGGAAALAPAAAVAAVALSLAGAVAGASRRIPVARPVQTALAGGFGLDAAATAVAGAAGRALRTVAAVDDRVFDPAATRLATATVRLFADNELFDRRVVDRAFNALADALRRASVRGRRIQTGLVEHYLVAVGVWLVLVAVASVAVLVRFGALGR
jgi:NADH-quinone oxidoreductase subunit L